MNRWNRRKFFAASAAVVMTAGAGVTVHTTLSPRRGLIRLAPVEGVAYSESFTRFMKRARFDSVRDAIASVRDASTPFRVVHESHGIS